MKKLLCILMALSMVLCLAACSGKGGNDGTTAAPDSSDTQSSDSANQNAENTTAAPISNAPGYNNGMNEKFDQLEYVAYCDLFYNRNTADYENKEMTKEGTFASIIDCYNGNITRYYVWGYADTTKCCCFQWEFVAPEGWKAPANGSRITVKGKLVASPDSLDGYWFDNCEITVDEEFAANDIDYDMTRISPTLVYVQVANMVYNTSYFDGKTLRLYGRAYTSSTIQHPYYDGSWQLDFIWDGDVPAIGEYMVLDGSFSATDGGCVVNATNLQLVD